MNCTGGNTDYDVYIGRWTYPIPINSKWRNRFRLAKDAPMEERLEVIEKYRYWILEAEQRYLLDSLPELKDKRLGCWCFRLPCHGDVLMDLVEKYVK